MYLVCSIVSNLLKLPNLLEITTILIAIATLVYMFVIDSFLFEYVWRKPISNGNYTIAITILFIFAIIAAVLVLLGFIEKIPIIGSNIIFQVVFSTSFAFLALILAIIFGIINVQPVNKEKICDPITGTFYIYWEKKHFGDKKYFNWKIEHIDPFEIDLYFLNRTIIPGACILSLFGCLSILYGILLYKYFKKDNNDTLNDMNIPINNENNTSYTSFSIKIKI